MARNQTLTACLAGVAAAGALMALPSTALAWSKGYVVDWYDFANWFGGEPGSPAGPGVDCPKGAEPEPDWPSLLKTSWRSEEEVAQMLADGRRTFGTPFGQRGPRPGPSVYRDPTLVPDPGMIEVEGNIALGFDLDGNPATGFNSPTGEKGIDNRLYKAIGCLQFYRGAYRTQDKVVQMMNEMRDGRYTVLVLVSGDGQDYRNDPNVTVGIYLSQDRIVKDANGEVAKDYSYRIDPDDRFQSVFKASTKDGILRTASPLPFLKIQHPNPKAMFPKELTLHKAQVQMELREDGTLHALIGGYADWRRFYKGWAAGGSVHEQSNRINLVALWYAFKRNADYLPDPETGEPTAISQAVQFDAVPAFLVTPTTNEVVTAAKPFVGPSVYLAKFDRNRENGESRGLGGDPNYVFEGGAAKRPWPAIPDPEGMAVWLDAPSQLAGR